MSAPLLQILPVDGHRPVLLSDDLQARLQALYERVPSVSCACDRLGQCCELTEAEAEADFATMYPLYVVEYLNIVDYLCTHFDSERREQVLGMMDERPERCPFLTDVGGCSIHPARPMACRTYGILNREQVEETASKARGEVPRSWISSFLFTERHTVCPHTTVREPEKVAPHARAMVAFEYERELLRMGQEVDLLGDARRQAFLDVTGLVRPTRWTWGGFNTLARSSAGWFKRCFAAYWKRAFLGE